MTRGEVYSALRSGKSLNEIFRFTEGQDCMIYKADSFEISDNVIYIPDLDLNEIITDRPLTEEEIEKIPIYTGKDFLSECNGKEDAARLLFSFCDWQHPCITDIVTELDENGNVLP